MFKHNYECEFLVAEVEDFVEEHFEHVCSFREGRRGTIPLSQFHNLVRVSGGQVGDTALRIMREDLGEGEFSLDQVKYMLQTYALNVK